MEPALKAFMLEVEKMKQFGFNDSEVQRATENILTGYEKAVEAAASRKNGDFVNPLLNNFYQNESYLEPELALQLAQSLCMQMNAQLLNQLVAQLEFVTDENMIVLVSYENGTSFILNFNNYDITTVVDGTKYTVKAYGYVVLTK